MQGGAPPGDTMADYGNTAGGPRGWFGGTNAPGAHDYTQAAQQTADSSNAQLDKQTLENRPNQTNAFGSSLMWTTGPDGRPMQVQSFGGPMQGVANSLMGQAQSTFSQSLPNSPFSFGGPMQGPGPLSLDPSSARDQAISGAYNQATSRLDPMFSQREEALRSQLLNQGLDPSSEAYQTQMANFGRERNDAYSSAMNGAIGQGTEAGSALFNQGLAGANFNADNAFRVGSYNDQNALTQHRQNLADALMGRQDALSSLGALGGLTGQAGFDQAGRGTGTDFMGAAGLQDESRFRNWQANNKAEGDFWSGLGNFGLNLANLIPGLGKKTGGG